MPGTDGLDAFARLTALEPPAAVVMLSTFGDEENVIRALRSGVDGFLLKDSGPEELIQAVRAAALGVLPPGGHHPGRRNRFLASIGSGSMLFTQVGFLWSRCVDDVGDRNVAAEESPPGVLRRGFVVRWHTPPSRCAGPNARACHRRRLSTHRGEPGQGEYRS